MCVSLTSIASKEYMGSSAGRDTQGSSSPRTIEFPSMLLDSCMRIAGVFFHRVDPSGEEPIPHEAWHLQKGRSRSQHVSGVPVARRVTLRCGSEGGFQMGQEGREKKTAPFRRQVH